MGSWLFLRKTRKSPSIVQTLAAGWISGRASRVTLISSTRSGHEGAKVPEGPTAKPVPTLCGPGSLMQPCPNQDCHQQLLIIACCAAFGVHALACLQAPDTLKGEHRAGLERHNERHNELLDCHCSGLLSAAVTVILTAAQLNATPNPRTARWQLHLRQRSGVDYPAY